MSVVDRLYSYHFEGIIAEDFLLPFFNSELNPIIRGYEKSTAVL